jgi:hypothetical protein
MNICIGFNGTKINQFEFFKLPPVTQAGFNLTTQNS